MKEHQERFARKVIETLSGKEKDWNLTSTTLKKKVREVLGVPKGKVGKRRHGDGVKKYRTLLRESEKQKSQVLNINAGTFKEYKKVSHLHFFQHFKEVLKCELDG